MANHEKLRIVLLAHDFSVSGAPKVIYDIFSELREHVELRTLSMREGPLRGMFEELGPVRVIDEVDRAEPGRISLEWLQFAFAFQPDLIYANTVGALVAAQKLPMPPAPVLFHLHDMGISQTDYARALPEQFYRWPSCYLTVSEATKKTLVERCGIKANQVRVIHACIPDAYADADCDRPAKTAPPFVIGGTGVVSWRKGGDLWLETALALVKSMGRESVRFKWVGLGSGVDDNEFVAYCHALGLEDSVEMVPTTREPLKHFTDFDVLAFTSFMDPCPLVVLENMMLRRPVAYFRGSGGAEEELGAYGLGVEAFDPAAMAAAIQGLLQNPEKRMEMANAARHRVMDKFLLSKQAPLILSLAREVAGG